LNWLYLLEKSEQNKIKTIKEIEFPYKQKRAYQNNLMKAVYETMENNEILYAIAPTGIGKTMATLFPALKSLKEKEKIFYATAKGSGKNAPLDAIKLLASNGLKLKTIDLTAKSKICNVCSKHCRPEECPYAKAGNLPKGTMLSLEAAEEEGMEIADKNTDIEAEVIETETMAEEIDALYKAISKLTPRQQKIVKMYYFEGKTQEEIGRYYGITQQAVRNALGKILAHLKKIF
jgi:RNA polymerase sigma factor (sigma-70 family)